MVFSTASILPSVINTWPGVSLGPETVWTVAPVSKMVSARSELTREKQSNNTAAARKNPGHDFGKRVGVGNKAGQASCLPKSAVGGGIAGGRPAEAGETTALRSCDNQVRAIIHRGTIRSLKVEMGIRMAGLLFVLAMPVLIVIPMLPRQLEELVLLLFAALRWAAAFLDPLRLFHQCSPLFFQRNGSFGFAPAVEIFFA